MSPNPLPPYFEHLPQHRVLLCQEHGRCTTLNELAKHLEKEHNVTKQDSNRICETARALDIAQSRSQIRAPANNSPHIKGLTIVEGLRCTVSGCEFVTISEGYFRKHLQEHGLPRAQKFEPANEVQLQNMYTVKAPLYYTVHPKVPPGTLGEDVRPRMPSGTTLSPGIARERPMEPRPGLPEQQEPEADNDQEQEETPDSEKENILAPTPIAIKTRRLGQTPRSALNPSLGRKARTGPSPSSRHARISASPPVTRRAPNRPLDHNTRPSPSPPPSRPAKRRATESSVLEPLPPYEPSFAQMMFRTERKDTGKIFLCVASDIMTADSRRLDPSPMNVDFNRYRRLLEEEGVIGDGFKLDFIDDTGKRVQVNNQVSFRAAVICQVSQKVDSIIFTSEPMPRRSLPAVKPVLSESRPPVSQQLGPLFAETVFCTERLNTDQTHVCLASNLRAPGSEPLNMRPTDVDFETYRTFLREAEVLDDDLVLGFIDSREKRIQVKNQAMFIAGVVYQVSKKVDMIRFSSVPITRPPLSSAQKPVPLGQTFHVPGQLSGPNDALTTPSNSKADERLREPTEPQSARPPMAALARPDPAPLGSRREHVDTPSGRSTISKPHQEEGEPHNSGPSYNFVSLNRRRTSPLPPKEKESQTTSPLKQQPIPPPKEKEHQTTSPQKQSPFNQERADRNARSRRLSSSGSSDEKADEKKREGRLRASKVGRVSEPSPGGDRPPTRNGLEVNLGRAHQSDLGGARPVARNIREFQLGRVNQQTPGGERPAATNGRKRRRDGE